MYFNRLLNVNVFTYFKQQLIFDTVIFVNYIVNIRLIFDRMLCNTTYPTIIAIRIFCIHIFSVSICIVTEVFAALRYSFQANTSYFC